MTPHRSQTPRSPASLAAAAPPGKRARLTGVDDIPRGRGAAVHSRPSTTRSRRGCAADVVHSRMEQPVARRGDLSDPGAMPPTDEHRRRRPPPDRTARSAPPAARRRSRPADPGPGPGRADRRAARADRVPPARVAGPDRHRRPVRPADRAHRAGRPAAAASRPAPSWRTPSGGCCSTTRPAPRWSCSAAGPRAEGDAAPRTRRWPRRSSPCCPARRGRAHRGLGGEHGRRRTVGLLRRVPLRRGWSRIRRAARWRRRWWRGPGHPRRPGGAGAAGRAGRSGAHPAPRAAAGRRLEARPPPSGRMRRRPSAAGLARGATPRSPTVRRVGCASTTATVVELACALSDRDVRDAALLRNIGPDPAAAEQLWTALVREMPDPEAAEPAACSPYRPCCAATARWPTSRWTAPSRPGQGTG